MIQKYLFGKFTSLINSYFLHWNFDWKSCFVVFFLEWNEWKNPQFNFSSQNLSIERNFSNEMEKKPKYHTYLSIEFGKKYCFSWKSVFLFIFLASSFPVFNTYLVFPQIIWFCLTSNLMRYTICKIHLKWGISMLKIT